jgi:hypothetical protein
MNVDDILSSYCSHGKSPQNRVKMLHIAIARGCSTGTFYTAVFLFSAVQCGTFYTAVVFFILISSTGTFYFFVF